MIRLARVTVLVLFALALTACGSDADTPATVDVATLVEAGSPGEVTVQGAVVWDDAGARLCEVLMESYPAQCGGASVPISNPDVITATFDEASGVRWTPGFVTLTGQFDGTQLAIG